MKLNQVCIFLACLLLLASCKHEPKPQKNISVSEEQLLRANEQLLQKEIDLMQQYVLRRDWKMEQTTSGVLFEIYQQTQGQPVKNGSLVSLAYDCFLINGNKIYNSTDDGLKTFSVGLNEVERGLEEIVKKMKKGEKAHILLPSHMAYGVTGDLDRIPPKSILIYDISIVELQ